MLHIAVVEDEAVQRERLLGYIARYTQEEDEPIYARGYADGDELLDDYEPGRFDLLLLDIQMERVDGMDCARRVRQADGGVAIVFITNLVRYAVEGYSVNALDFVVKPVHYQVFKDKLSAAIACCRRGERRRVRLKTPGGVLCLDKGEVVCLEVVARSVYVHTPGESYRISETLNGAEALLDDGRFFRCHSAFLVNLEYVREVRRAAALVHTREVPISRHRKKEFMDALTNAIGREG